MRGRHVNGALAIILIASALAVSQHSSFAQPATRAGDLPVLVVVRHANKAAEPTDDPPLTPAGGKRAHDLAAALHDTGVSGIVTTQLRRTRETAEPLASELGITPEVIQRGPRGSEEHLKAIVAAARQHVGVVLVVGHDDTVPDLIAYLGGPRLPPICDPIYDNLFVLIPSVRGNVRLMHGRYGAPTPDSECKQ